ncbi:hypothetical protein ENUP19_0307G0003 [Entamoeba nuttalli]|uniref:Ras GTPase-activating protein, putative n=2 Tax=Entamoeba nuttalli TaxID=412467 RepID=K2G5W4_ENTNP|nr:Ras GTPase-activating protein, putative [Entamoeba nuttalli P19]EKE37766.1 Ras GTPase-activating protein, putative [Entamoeba nuttalli P19]|eukprot:XP_008859900.1 Ras GTPase-activating protein, putative [Entamoeba nuttalli P19]
MAFNKEKKDSTVDDGNAIVYPSDYSRALDDSYLYFINLLTNDLEIARIFGESLPITSQDLFSNLICDLFCEVHVIDDFIELLLKQEFQTNVLTATLFRTNSLCTKVQTAYARKECQNFMMEVFQPIIQKVIAMPPLELDPIKLQTLYPNKTEEQLTEEANNSLQKLEDLSDEVIATLRRHLRNTPTPLSVMCHQIRESCFLYHTDDPDIALSLIGGFVFLRLFCPALAAPEGSNLCGTAIVPPTARRTLILLTKILQNIANNVRETKEPWMTNSLPYVMSRGPALQAYLKALSNAGIIKTKPTIIFEASQINPPLVIELHRLLNEAVPNLTTLSEKGAQQVCRRLPWSKCVRRPSTRAVRLPDPQGLLKNADLLGPSPRTYQLKIPKFIGNAPTGDPFRDFLSSQHVTVYIGRSPKQEALWYVSCERVAQGMMERGFLTGYTKLKQFIPDNEIIICDFAWVVLNQVDAIADFVKHLGTGKIIGINAHPSIRKQIQTAFSQITFEEKEEIRKAFGDIPKVPESLIYEQRDYPVIQKDKKNERVLRIGYTAIYIIDPRNRKISEKLAYKDIGEFIGFSKSGAFHINHNNGLYCFTLKSALERGQVLADIYMAKTSRRSLFSRVEDFEFLATLVGKKGEKEIECTIIVTPTALLLVSNKIIDREICFCAIDTIDWTVQSEKGVSREIVKIECRSNKKDEIISDMVRITVPKDVSDQFKEIINSVVIQHKC